MKPLIVTVLLFSLAACSGDAGVVCPQGTNCQTTGGETTGGETTGGETTGGETTGGGTTDGGTGDDLVVTGLTATHRSGQTFLRWDEPHTSAHYHIYRAGQPISTANLSSATLLTSRWGPVDQDSSINKYATDDVPGYFVVEDLGEPLSYNTGFFVHTTQSGQSGSAYYAVTAVLDGTEARRVVSGSNTIASPVNESVDTPIPVLTASVNGGKGRIYTQYMDYANWNPTLNGYAFNYSVALPFDYTPERSYPLQVELHAFGSTGRVLTQTDYNWQVIQIHPNDPGEGQNAIHTWWYGHAADHNYLTEGAIPFQGQVENFTEQRVLRAINEVIANSDYNVNADLIHAYGNSMGASGSVSFALRYPYVFSGIYASQPMTNYATNPLFQENLQQLWGQQARNLPIVNRGPNADAIADYGEDGTQPTGVWDWMNHQQQLRRRRGDDFAFLLMDFGKNDNTIDWQSQGRPMLQALTDSNVGFAATALEGVGHNWLAFNAVNVNQFGFGNDELAPWRYPNSLSFVALQNASGSGPVPPGVTGSDEYNQNIEWSTPQNAFDENIVDSADRYEISLRSLAGDQTVSVTPRNTQAFFPPSGKTCEWTAVRISDRALIGGERVVVDGDDLVTGDGVLVVGGSGTRVVFDCS